ncbi:MAG: hypothetical protein EOP55_11225 [Sphingobacteriales bacterium]|nr:MAG: hypothetical protein EOP55_11225 [Sphingobacteriales bacterium]
MRKINTIKPYSVALIILLLASCNGYDRDKQIKQDLTMKAKEDVNFVGLNFIVRKRNVDIWGNCPTLRAKHNVMKKLNTIHVIKGVTDRITIAPVNIDTNLAVKQLVDSLLAKHPRCWAQVINQNIFVEGQVKKEQIGELLASIHQKVPNRVLIDKTVIN